jgi:hypothetical protein
MFPLRPNGGPKRAPDYNLIRFITAADAAPYTNKNLGCDFSTFVHGALQVIPVNTADIRLLNTQPLPDLFTGATSNPAFAVRYWSDDLGLFLPRAPAQTLAAVGAGLAYELDLPNINGRRIFLECTGGITASQGVLIFAAGAVHHESL